jgi:hypothetical protein
MNMTVSARPISAAILLALCVYWFFEITTTPIESDAAQTLLMGVNLAHNGTISLSKEPPYLPTHYREPLPALITAGMVRVIDAFLGPAEPQAYNDGDRARLVKLQNVGWLVVMFVGGAAIVFWFTSSVALSLVATLLAVRPFTVGRVSITIDSLFTDLHGAALLVVAAGALAVATTSARPRHYAAAGALFGLLTLTKATFLYISLLMMPLLFVFHWALGDARARSARLIAVTWMIVMYGLVVGPWIFRNFVELGTLQIADRGGVMLLGRAAMDSMSSEEFRGTFYVWGDPRLQPLLGRVLGFSPADLQKGGRLQRLNESPDSGFYESDLAAEDAGTPEAAVTYFEQSRAEREKIRSEVAAENVANPDALVDKRLTRLALERIEGNIGGHLRMTIAMLWRCCLVSVCFLLIALPVTLLRRNYALAALIVPALMFLSFNAFVSNFFPRYELIDRPLVIVIAAVSFHLLWARRRGDTGRSPFPRAHPPRRQRSTRG